MFSIGCDAHGDVVGKLQIDMLDAVYILKPRPTKKINDMLELLGRFRTNKTLLEWEWEKCGTAGVLFFFTRDVYLFFFQKENKTCCSYKRCS
jgi:hypothetical protein